jgi:hypothetical protein
MVQQLATLMALVNLKHRFINLISHYNLAARSDYFPRVGISIAWSWEKYG